MQIIPTINRKNFNEVKERLIDLEGTTRWIQIDVADGVLTPGKSFELELLSRVEGNWLWDIHLRVREPTNWIEKCIFVGASRIIGQIEMMARRDEFVEKVKNEGLEVGLGFDIDTEVDGIPDETDMVLLMSRKAGFEVKPFEEKVYDKIKKVKDKGFIVGIDGGVGIDHLQKLRELGVDVIYSESNYFELINANR